MSLPATPFCLDKLWYIRDLATSRMVSRLPIRCQARGRVVCHVSRKPLAKLMNNIDKSQVTNGRKSRPVNSTAFSAAWGRVLALALLTLSAVPSNAGTRAALDSDNDTPRKKFSADLQQRAGANGMVDIIVQYQQMPGSSHLKAMQDGGATIKSKLHTIHGVAMRVPASMLPVLAKNPNVAYITPDRPVSLASSNEDYTTAIEKDLAVAQFAFNGNGIGVAVIDSGIADHPDLHNANGTSRVVYSQSFVAGDTTTSDKYGHGTHVAGLVGGSGVNSGTANGYSKNFAGVAPGVNFINLRVLDQNGAGTDSQVISAIQQAITLKNTYNIRVINISLGRPTFESYTLDPVCQAVESAWKAGIVVVVAAGNDGRNNSMGTNGFATIGVPANDPAVITVGATRTAVTETRVDDGIASYSSKGPTSFDHLVKPDLVAPGNGLVSLLAVGSTLDKNYKQLEVVPSSGTPKYFRLSGTSMATPLVSGTVAMMLQQNSSLTPDQVKARLMKTAWKGFAQYGQSSDSLGNIYSNQYDIFTYGAGYLDVDATLNNTDLSTGVALSPTAVYNSSNNTVTLTDTSTAPFGGTSVVWGATSVVWGKSVVWGASTITGTSVVWGSTSVVWGAKSLSGFSVVWGSKSITASSIGSYSTGIDGDN
jgi:serine protease AprX